MDPKKLFTSEKLNKRFTSAFDLVNYAIKLAKNMIQTGRASRIDTPVQNRAYQILKEIVDGKDSFDDIDGKQGERENPAQK